MLPYNNARPLTVRMYVHLYNGVCSSTSVHYVCVQCTHVCRLVYFRNFPNASLQCCTCVGCGVNTSVAHVTAKFVGQFRLLKCAVTKLRTYIHTMSRPRVYHQHCYYCTTPPSPSPLPLQCTHCLLRPCELLLVSEPIQTTMKWDRPICGALGKGVRG